MEVFLGPKLRSVVANGYFGVAPRDYDSTLVQTSWPCGFCTWEWLINVLVGMLAFFNTVLRDWGLAIILLVVIVRVLLHPVTKRSQISMSKMGKMGPEFERLKKKYADNPDELKRVQAEFIREQGVAPFLGCLPMFLQMPIWIALWQALQTSFELRHAPFLFTYIRDLSQPDRLIPFGRSFDFLFIHIQELNVLPLLLGVVFYLQQKFTPKPATMTKEQEQQQKIMMYMTPFIFPLILYTGPSGLNLYILTSTVIGIIESKRIRDHLKEREELEKAGAVIVDATDDDRRGGKGGGRRGADGTAAVKPAGGIVGWLAKLQNMAEEVRKDPDRRKKGK